VPRLTAVRRPVSASGGEDGQQAPLRLQYHTQLPLRGWTVFRAEPACAACTCSAHCCCCCCPSGSGQVWSGPQPWMAVSGLPAAAVRRCPGLQLTQQLAQRVEQAGAGAPRAADSSSSSWQALPGAAQQVHLLRRPVSARQVCVLPGGPRGWWWTLRPVLAHQHLTWRG